MRVKHIIRFTALFIMLAAGFVIAQGTIQGTVSDQDGSALPGANVVVEGTSLGGSTDGNYFIIIPPGGSVALRGDGTNVEPDEVYLKCESGETTTIEFIIAIE